MSSKDRVTFTATSPVEIVAKRPLRFPVPLGDVAKDPQDFAFWWSQLQVIFDFADPRDFPALPTRPSPDELRVLERFIAKARDLAGSGAINSDAGVSIDISDDGESETVRSDFPPPDVIAGFAAVFRQFYATDEKASFRMVSGILMQQAQAAQDEAREARIDELKKWGRAIGRVKQKSVERLAHEYLAAEGLFPALAEEEAEHYPDLEIPDQAISAYFYGEHLHWGEKSAILDQRAEDPVNEALFLLGFLKAATGLAHLYIGYSLLAQAALGAR